MADAVAQTHYIYLLQEREFIKTGEPVYKLGRTTQANHDRLKQYPKGSVLLFQMICLDCVTLEKYLIQDFKRKFTHRKDIGAEYFEGKYQTMIDSIFFAVRKQHMDKTPAETVKEADTEGDVKESADEIVDEKQIADIKNSEKITKRDEKIAKVFADYKSDESFGGTKKLIKIISHKGDYVVYYINPELTVSNSMSFYKGLSIHIMEKNTADKLQYFYKLIQKQIILLDMVYDINSIKFINKINKTKINIIVENFRMLERTHKLAYDEITTERKINHILYRNILVNNCLYATMKKQREDDEDDVDLHKKFNKLDNFGQLNMEVGLHVHKNICLRKINSKWYDESFLRRYTPCHIVYDDMGNYWLVNYYNYYIGVDKRLQHDDSITKERLFQYSNIPWIEQENLVTMRGNLKALIKSKNLHNIQNANKFTEFILNSL